MPDDQPPGPQDYAAILEDMVYAIESPDGAEEEEVGEEGVLDREVIWISDSDDEEGAFSMPVSVVFRY